MATTHTHHVRDLEALQTRITSLLDSFHALVNELQPDLPRATLLDKYNVLSYKFEKLAKEIRAPHWQSCLVQPWSSVHPDYYPILKDVILSTTKSEEWTKHWEDALKSPAAPTPSTSLHTAGEMQRHNDAIDERLDIWHMLKEEHFLKSRVGENVDEDADLDDEMMIATPDAPLSPVDT